MNEANWVTFGLSYVANLASWRVPLVLQVGQAHLLSRAPWSKTMCCSVSNQAKLSFWTVPVYLHSLRDRPVAP